MLPSATDNTVNWLFEPWPEWARRPWGLVARLLVALAGIAFGGLLVFLAYFGATFKKTPPVWTLELIVLAAVGVLVGLVGLAWAIRPSRITAMAVVLALVAPVIAGSLV